MMDKGIEKILQKDKKKWKKQDKFVIVSEYFHVMHEEMKRDGMTEARMKYFAEGIFDFFEEGNGSRIRTVLWGAEGKQYAPNVDNSSRDPKLRLFDQIECGECPEMISAATSQQYCSIKDDFCPRALREKIRKLFLDEEKKDWGKSSKEYRDHLNGKDKPNKNEKIYIKCADCGKDTHIQEKVRKEGSIYRCHQCGSKKKGSG